MALDLRLDAKMTQSLVMSPRMQQAIKILQYNHMEMVSAIQEAILENPTLETSSDGGETLVEVEYEHAQKEAARSKEDSGDAADSGTPTEGGIDWEKVLEQMGDRKNQMSSGGTIHDDLPPIETNLTYGESLAEHLVWQLQMVHLTEEERSAADTIVHKLDDRGYLASTVEEIALSAEVDAEDVESALGIIHSLDPVGCGARDLAECLILQARVHFPEDETFERILRGHLNNLERRNYGAIAKELGLDQEDVIEYHRMIQELEPHPGRGYGNDQPRYITPDVYVDRHGDEWIILLNEEGMPDLRISPYYQKIMRGASKTDRQYLIDKLRGAEFLIRSINKRRKTIRRVMESILKFQREFFDNGVGNLRPLVLQDVASDIGVHMSTVSRVTANKYVHTPHGIFELKYFFSAGVKQSTGEDVAAEAVKRRIKMLVQAEETRRPMSDQQIADLLKREGDGDHAA